MQQFTEPRDIYKAQFENRARWATQSLTPSARQYALSTPFYVAKGRTSSYNPNTNAISLNNASPYVAQHEYSHGLGWNQGQTQSFPSGFDSALQRHYGDGRDPVEWYAFMGQQSLSAIPSELRQFFPQFKPAGPSAAAVSVAQRAPGRVPAGTSRMPGATQPAPVLAAGGTSFPSYNIPGITPPQISPLAGIGQAARSFFGIVAANAAFPSYNIPGIAEPSKQTFPSYNIPGVTPPQVSPWSAFGGQKAGGQKAPPAGAVSTRTPADAQAAYAARYAAQVPTFGSATGAPPAPRQTVTEAGVTLDPRSALAYAARYTGTALDLAVKQNRPDWRPNILSETLVAELPIQMWGYTDMATFLNDFGYAPDPNRPGVWNRLDAGKPTITGAGGGYGGSGGYGDYNDDSGWNDYGGGWGG